MKGINLATRSVSLFWICLTRQEGRDEHTEGKDILPELRVVFFALWMMIIYVFALVLRQVTEGQLVGTQLLACMFPSFLHVASANFPERARQRALKEALEERTLAAADGMLFPRYFSNVPQSINNLLLYGILPDQREIVTTLGSLARRQSTSVFFFYGFSCVESGRAWHVT